ncbi:ankyrin repeat domain-containing protein [Vibrio crassostreae]|uniref:ankyrin repeat domain-containing protein n=1 Tax=Vibrio crassostreae TaxID=246167 RepID=UPI000F49F0C4|nr:ankyrin repeat domain-containing protein [Vibrio crassostreae]ROR24042.1 hypothetical protein EDB67_10550 [Vibrio crassostreae]TCV21751.1 hypothetical protein EDB71_11865 [Vibrio crassostreae]CAK2112138.1 exported hypothetical protein [Vibrio crassostreae]CAK2116847.1 exported hypothetical protein [Vibrio crassostreae]CAK2122963.1 exported hypothetical protein [Vibrio crassostreae]
MKILKKLTSIILVISSSLVFAIDDENFKSLMQWEGMGSVSIGSESLTRAIDKLVTSQGRQPSFEDLLRASKSTDERDLKDTYFVLALFSSAISNSPEKGIEALKLYQPKQTYMDSLAQSTTAENILDNSYAWLVNNANFTLPKSLVSQYPDLIVNSTPFWGATRDGYFDVEKTEAWNKVFETDELRTWRGLLNDIETPSKDVWLGSMRNAKFKREAIIQSLMINNIDYFSANYHDLEPSQWLGYWKLQGIYENAQYQKYQKAKKMAVSLLTRELTRLHHVSSERANHIAKSYLNSIEKTYIYHQRFVEQYDSVFAEMKTSGWKSVLKNDDLVGESLWYGREVYFGIGGYLLLNEPQEFSEYLTWLSTNGFDGVLSEMLGFAAAKSDDLQTLLHGFSDMPETWGAFNKTPLMYAAQYDNSDSIEFLTHQFPSLIEQRTLGAEQVELSWGIPKIGDRTFVTYALEHASAETVFKVLSKAPDRMLKATDTDGRNVLYYLAMNRHLVPDERKSILAELKLDQIDLPTASFTCLNAESRIEILTCGTPENARTDTELSNRYELVKESLQHPDDQAMLIQQQRHWLVKRSSIFNDISGSESLIHSYERQINEISSFNNSECRKENGNSIKMKGQIVPNPGWMRMLTDDGKKGVGYFWPGSAGYFPCNMEWDLSTRNNFHQYSVMKTDKNTRYASVPINNSSYYLSLIAKRGAIHSSVLGTPVSLVIDDKTFSNKLSADATEALRNAKEVTFQYDGETYSISTKGSGATVIWLLAKD